MNSIRQSQPSTLNAMDSESLSENQALGFPLLAVLAFLLVLFLRPGEFLPFLEKVRLAIVCFAVALGAWLLTGRPTRVFNHSTNRLAIGLAAVMALSVPLSYWPIHSLETLGQFVRQVLLYVLIVNVVGNLAQIIRCLWIVSLGNSCHAALIVEKFLSGELYSGRRRHESGLYGDPNDSAHQSCHAAADRRCSVFPEQTLDRTDVVALRRSTGLRSDRGHPVTGRFARVGGRRRLIIKDSRHKWWVGFIAGTIAIFILVTAPASTFDRYATIREFQSDESAQGRLAIWKLGLRMYADHPIIGVGAGAFDVAFGKQYGPESGTRYWFNAHNSLLQVAAELGTMGAALWVALIWSGFSVLRSAQVAVAEAGESLHAEPVWQMCRALRHFPGWLPRVRVLSVPRGTIGC